MTHEILTPDQTREIDRLCIARGMPINTLIDNAGRAVAEEIARRYGARPTVVLCGPGNNGKDGQVAAEYLRRWGWPVSVSDDLAGAGLIIDALYGAGLNRQFPAELAHRINSAGVPVVSIDVPSGLDGLTGQPRGACVKADLTITFFRTKPAHVLLPGRSLCGEVVVADIGIPPSVLDVIKPALHENSAPALPHPQLGDHKYRKGHVVVVSGDALHTGAARLAARAALSAGAGLVSLAGSEAALAVHAHHLSTIMLAAAGNALALGKVLGDERKNAVCIGPAAGVGPKTMANVAAALASPAAVVLDADALTSFQQNPSQLFDLIRQRPHGAATVMTPHDGEFTRIFKGLGLQAESKIERAVKAAEASGAIVLLKGADTVIAAPDGQATVNTNAPPTLATAGSGDVLAGIIVGLLAQGMNGFEAASAGAWLHGAAAARAPSRGLTAEDVIDHLYADQ